MRARWLYILAVCFVFPLQTAKACTCKNSTPIQRTSKRYAGQSVFTARIVALLGQTYHYGGKPSSSKVIALVQTRSWGIPWYWPNLVVLDGGTLCGMTLYLGEEYLVAGHPERYGVLDVSGCTGTKVLIAAQPDLRTLDGSTCAAPGGTIIGQIMQGEYPKLTPIADLTVSVKTQTVNSSRLGPAKMGSMSSVIFQPAITRWICSSAIIPGKIRAISDQSPPVFVLRAQPTNNEYTKDINTNRVAPPIPNRFTAKS